LFRIRDLFVRHMEAITTGNGIHLTQDTGAPEQGSFVVPNLGITIVPLVYGDHHSWNLAWLGSERSDVPYHLYHLHSEGVEIHFGNHLAIVVHDTDDALKIWRDRVGLTVLYSEVVNQGAIRLTHLEIIV